MLNEFDEISYQVLITKLYDTVVLLFLIKLKNFFLVDRLFEVRAGNVGEGRGGSFTKFPPLYFSRFPYFTSNQQGWGCYLRFLIQTVVPKVQHLYFLEAYLEHLKMVDRTDENYTKKVTNVRIIRSARVHEENMSV